jgi:hypothetical protein
MHSDDDGSDGGGSGGSGGGSGGSGGSGRFECENCHITFPNKTTVDRHMLFCKTLADIRRGGGSSVSSTTTTQQTLSSVADDALMPTPREMFILIQELAAKYNKVKDELNVMKQWAKMVGRRIGSTAGAGASASASAAAASGLGNGGLDFTSVTRQKRQNIEVILNEEDAEHSDLAELRPGFTEWLTASPSLNDADLKVVFNEDLVAGITAAILRVLSEYTAETGRSHLLPFKLADIKQGAFYIYDTAFGVAAAPPPENGLDLPTQPTRRWRAMEPCEFQLLVRTFHKLLFKEFKKWQDENWDAQKQITQQRQNAASSFQHVMSSFQCSPAMASCDGMYDTPVSEPVLSEDFATLYNKYADKMMGGALSDDTILSRVRAKLWKDMKAWRL